MGKNDKVEEEENPVNIAFPLLTPSDPNYVSKMALTRLLTHELHVLLGATPGFVHPKSEDEAPTRSESLKQLREAWTAPGPQTRSLWADLSASSWPAATLTVMASGPGSGSGSRVAASESSDSE